MRRYAETMARNLFALDKLWKFLQCNPAGLLSVEETAVRRRRPDFAVPGQRPRNHPSQAAATVSSSPGTTCIA